MCVNYEEYPMWEKKISKHVPFSSFKVWSYGGRMLWTDPVPSDQSKLSASEPFQPQRPSSKVQEVPQYFSSVPSPQSSLKSQLCPAEKHWPFSQGRKPAGHEPGNNTHIKCLSDYFSGSMDLYSLFWYVQQQAPMKENIDLWVMMRELNDSL